MSVDISSALMVPSLGAVEGVAESAAPPKRRKFQPDRDALMLILLSQSS